MLQGSCTGLSVLCDLTLIKLVNSESAAEEWILYLYRTKTRCMAKVQCICILLNVLNVLNLQDSSAIMGIEGDVGVHGSV